MTVLAKIVIRLTVLIALFVAVSPGRAAQDDPQLEALFNRLQSTTNAVEAKTLERGIWSIWMEIDDPRAQDLLVRGSVAMSHRQFETAEKNLSELVAYKPGFAEAWNKRATLYFLVGDFEASVKDIQATLRLEPRHFGALTGLGMIYEAIGDADASLKTFEAALTINPHMGRVRDRVRRLRSQAKGI
ncbi:MAG: tetratricopeptide repeat protein [Geminicoccaceae bacterium]